MMKKYNKRWFILISILLILLFFTEYQVSRFLPRQTSLPWLLTILYFFLMLGWQFAYRFKAITVDSPGFKILVWVGSLCLGLWSTFIVLVLPFDVGNWAFTLWHHVDPYQVGRITRYVTATLFAISFAITILGLKEVFAGPHIKHVVIAIDNLPEPLQGFKIAQISDLHVGPTIRRDYVAQVVAKVLALKADLIAVTGDLADGSVAALKSHLQPLANLTAPHGVFYVTGNHEYYWNAEHWLAKAQDLGFIPLINENRVLNINGAAFLIAGVTDTSAQHFIPEHASNPAQAIKTTQQSQFNLLLAHRPDSCIEAEPVGFHLQLSGHTHGGQFFPWNFLVWLAHDYYRGLHRHGNMWVYVNAGTGYWGPAHRFAVPAEITLIELTREIQSK